METVKGGRKVTVTMEDGSQQEVLVSKLKIAKWEEAFKKFDSEMELTALICGRTVPWIHGTPPDHANALTEESYTELVKVSKEVNENGFFPFAQRRNDSLAERIKLMPRSFLQEASSILKASATNPLSSGSPAVPPSPV